MGKKFWGLFQLIINQFHDHCSQKEKPICNRRITIDRRVGWFAPWAGRLWLGFDPEESKDFVALP